tara:strand:+ start:254 stop:406 length:153 start_codon:yes stop_codon:yes gene_type:complete
MVVQENLKNQNILLFFNENNKFFILLTNEINKIISLLYIYAINNVTFRGE